MAFRDYHTAIKADSHYMFYMFFPLQTSSQLSTYRSVICPTAMTAWRVDFQGQEPKDITHLQTEEFRRGETKVSKQQLPELEYKPW